MQVYNVPSRYSVAPLILGAQKYIPFNGFAGSNYPSHVPSFQQITITFANPHPDNGSQLVIPDGSGAFPSGTKTFTFTYSGAPGPGIIPLVAGGGTPAQAATAAQVALAAQLNSWNVTNPSAGVLVLVAKLAGVNSAPIKSNFPASGAIVATQVIIAGLGKLVPGRFGKNYCAMPAGSPFLSVTIPFPSGG